MTGFGSSGRRFKVRSSAEISGDPRLAMNQLTPQPLWQSAWTSSQSLKGWRPHVCETAYDLALNAEIDASLELHSGLPVANCAKGALNISIWVTSQDAERDTENQRH